MHEVREYVDRNGRNGFREWLIKLDIGTRARIGEKLIVLLLGVSKRRQESDIGIAHVLWAEYEKRKQEME